MKKIFAISVLSVMAVVATSDAWAMATPPNYNLATVHYVEDIVYDELGDYVHKNAIIPTGTTPTISKDSSVPSFARSEDLIQEAIISTTETASNTDAQAPTIARMEAAIANAKPDTSGLVDKAHVVNSQGNNWNGESVAEDAVTNKDDYVLTYGAAAKAINSVNNDLSAVINNKIDKVDIVTLAEDAAAVAEMEAGTNDAKYDTVVPSYRTVYNALNLLEAETDTGLKSKVDIAQGEGNKNAIMITNSAGNVIPAPVGDCANTTNKCALVTGVDESGNLVLQWEVIARNVVQPTVEE